MIAKSIKEALEALPPEFKTKAAINTLQYVFQAIGHKCLLIVKHKEEIFQILLRPSKISNHYRKFLPKTLKKKLNVRLMHCIVKEFKKEEGEDRVTLNLFKNYEKAGHTLPQGVYLVSPTDVLIYRKNFKDPFYHVTGSTTSPISLQHPLLPILAWCGHKDYLDVPIPMIDDIQLIKGLESMENSILNVRVAADDVRTYDLSKIELDFSKKKPLAVFRGTSTGCGWTVDTNPRLKAVQLSKEYPELLDAQLTTITKGWKIHKTRRAGRILSKDFQEGSKISFEDQSQYKYILHLDGNVGAYRLAQWMLLGSTILLQESGTTLWFQHRLEPWLHYVPVKDGLNDLIEKIQWCKEHEEECERMGRAARTLALRILTSEFMYNELDSAIEKARIISQTNGKREK
jgi:hypothetical protein